MKKILILGLIFAAVGCSNEPEIDLDAVALELLKGSYLTDGTTTGTIARSYISQKLLLNTAEGQTITIGDDLDFSIATTVVAAGETVTPLEFEYLEVKNAWAIYKVTYSDKAAQYTAITAGKGDTIITEHSAFRATQAEVTTDSGSGFEFLAKKQ